MSQHHQLRRRQELPRPSTIEGVDDVGDLVRDEKSGVLISAGSRDKGPEIRGLRGKRLVHESTEPVEIQYEDDKRQHRVNRKIDFLREMFNRDEITQDLYSSGLRFQDDFDKSHWGMGAGMRFDNLPASGRVSTDGGRTDTIVASRRSVMDAIKALGGTASLGGIVAWQIIGLRKSLTEMSNDNGDHRSLYKGAFITALDILGLHYEALGYKRRENTRR